MRAEDKLARHVAELRWLEVPEPARAALRRLVLDAVAVMLAGHADADCRKVATGLAGPGGRVAASIVGRRGRVAAADAALANGAFAHWHEWDDTHDDSHVHGGAVIFPALFAASEVAGLDPGREAGEAFAAAAVAAYDVACRVGGLLKPHAHRGWMPTGTGGAVGAAAGAARLLGLGEKGVRSAMGLASLRAGLTRQGLADRVSAKSILGGIAARVAIESALLARAGAEGPPRFLTGAYGLNALYAAGRGDPAEATAGLGRRFSVTEVSIKPYPCCRSNHPALDVVLDLLGEEPGAGAAVRAVHILAPEGLYERCGKPFAPGDNPRVAAQFSMPFTVALALRKGRIAPADFAPEAVLADAAGIADLIPRITVEPVALPPGSDDVMVPVTLRFRMGGRATVERTARVVKGSPARPLAAEEEREKLAIASAGGLSPAAVKRLVAPVAALAEIGPAPLLARLRAVARQGAPGARGRRVKLSATTS
ncbi:MAG: MmgE/PrpD family protein [Proteobacteria bacterium]|nr:MmgE/PrpD family protein [Pseudomonadota bacterium]